MDPIYFTDDYPRAGCCITIGVSLDGCTMHVVAPVGKTIESYGPVPHCEIGRMVEEWLAGRPPKLKLRLHSPSATSIVTE